MTAGQRQRQSLRRTGKHVRNKLTSIHKSILPETLTQAHSLNPHVLEDVLDRFWHVSDGTGSVRFGLAVGDAWHAAHLEFEGAVGGKALVSRF